MTNRKRLHNGTAVGVSNDIGTLHLQIIEQCRGGGHVLKRIRRIDFLFGPRLFESNLDIGGSPIAEFRRQPNITDFLSIYEETGIHQGRNQRFRPCENLRAAPTDKQQCSSATHTPSLIFYFNTVNPCLRDPANSFFKRCYPPR